jgi:hypothetical protein
MPSRGRIATTHRRARQPGVRSLRLISSPRVWMCASKPRAFASSRTRSRQGPCGEARVGWGRSSRASTLGASSRAGGRRRAPARAGPVAPRREASVSPPFRPIGGIRPCLRASPRRLAHGAVGGQPGRVDPHHPVVVEQALPPDLLEDARLAGCRPLVNPDSSPRADRRKQAKWTGNGRSTRFGALHSSPEQETQVAVLQDF